ncbi:tetratricopeptide repeat protein [Parasphingorhabdus sp.]|uniref:tetratricopeptide repeat protein n=1 Tax=Parasphingorhabdus sp. TaxID=2709688 RepID=UPI0030025C8A
MVTNPPQDQMNALIALYQAGQFAAVAERAQALAESVPSSFILWNIFGAANMALGRTHEAEQGFSRAIKLNPDYPDAYVNMGNMLQKQGKLDQAIAAYQRALAIKSDHPDACYNMGNAQAERGKLDEAIASYRRALALRPDYAEAQFSIGNALQKQGRLDAAIAAYQRALAIKSDYGEAYNNIGNVLQKQGRLDEAIAAFQRALALKPDHADAHNNIGNALQDQGKPDAAISAYLRALARNPGHADAHYNMGNALQKQDRPDEAIAAYQQAVALNPDHNIAEARLILQRQHICDWRHIDQLGGVCARLGLTAQAINPFMMLSAEDDAARQMARSQNWAVAEYKQAPIPLAGKPDVRPERLRIGYFSADFHDHATLCLMAGLLREHDAARFELFAYSYGGSNSGEWRRRAEGDVDHFCDVTALSDAALVDLARSHGLDVAIDLKGYTQHTRSGLFQYRLAPIQISYLGYPGTMATTFIDYLIADPTIIPADQRRFYSERLIYLPHSYQPNDDAREIAATSTTRADFGLPEHGFIFCCFNNNYKISPKEFDIWMRLLRQVDDSVLWLLRSNKWAERNLKKEAEARGVDPSRLVFADRIPHADQLARHQHADLFLDTFNYNAHTTASDALWAGLPVVTKQGQQFAARVAASLLNAVGLAELITTTEPDYEALILELATNRDRLKQITDRLASNRLTEPLFDTKRYTRNFERGLQQAYDLYFDDKEPHDFAVSES